MKNEYILKNEINGWYIGNGGNETSNQLKAVRFDSIKEAIDYSEPFNKRPLNAKYNPVLLKRYSIATELSCERFSSFEDALDFLKSNPCDDHGKEWGFISDDEKYLVWRPEVKEWHNS